MQFCSEGILIFDEPNGRTSSDTGDMSFKSRPTFKIFLQPTKSRQFILKPKYTGQWLGLSWQSSCF